MTKLRQFIAQHGLKQVRIAELTGINQSSVSDYCRGLVPSDEIKVRIVAVLRECTGRDLTVEDFWPAPVPQEAA